MKLKLSLLPLNGGAFNCLPAREIELEPENILCNNVRMPWETGRSILYCLGNEFGAMGAVWADCEGDAIDELIDQNLAGGILVDEPENPEDEENEDVCRGGNYGVPYSPDYLWVQTVRLDPEKDCRLIAAFSAASALCADNLNDGRISL